MKNSQSLMQIIDKMECYVKIYLNGMMKKHGLCILFLEDIGKS